MIEEFDDQIPSTVTFSVGYFSGHQSTKYWLYTQEDLDEMYAAISSKEILLWCDGRTQNEDEGSVDKKEKDQ